MDNLNSFQINKKNDAFENILQVKNITEQYVGNKFLSLLIENYSKLFDCPKNVLSHKAKQILAAKFNYKIGRFSINYSYFSVILDFFAINTLLILLKIFKKKIKPEKYDIILDDVEHINQLFLFKKLLSKFKKSIVFSKRVFFNNNKEIKKFKIKFSHFFLLDKESLNIDLISFIKINLNILKQSHNNKINLFIIFKPVLYSLLKYNYFFKKYNAKFLIHDRFYRTCPIRNYIFKKNGGKKICLTQIHLCANNLSLFVDIDQLFSFGDETFSKQKFIKLGGKVNETFPIGSIKMESLFHEENSKNLIEKFDIVFIGINLHNWINESDETNKNFYRVIEWLKKISIKYPEYKILIKHHASWWGDSKEKQIIKNSNIKTFLKENHPTKIENLINNHFFSKFKIFLKNIYIGDNSLKYKENESYYFLNQSKINLSFGSTMIIEAVGNNKSSYFVDPDLKNSSHFSELAHLDPLRISSFNMLENIIKTKIENSSVDKNLNKKVICLESNNTSDRIYNYLTN